jgi:hypothetical protein
LPSLLRLLISLKDVNVNHLSYHHDSVFLLFICLTNSFVFVAVLFDLANETTKYLFPKRSGSRDLEEALMAGTHISFFLFCLNFITSEVEQSGKWLGSSLFGCI